MPATFRLTLVQANPSVGDLAGNAALAKQAWAAGKAAVADLVALTEMFLTGYQTQDLVLKPAFVAAVADALAQLAAEFADGPALGIGAPHRAGRTNQITVSVLRRTGDQARRLLAPPSTVMMVPVV